jgi:hypothetical protein
MSAGLIAAAVDSTTSTSNGPSLANLWAPPVFGAGLAALIVILAGIFAWGMSDWPGFGSWLKGSVYAGPAWTAKDSWVTNIGAIGAILGTVVTASNAALKSVVIQPAAAADVTILFIVFGGAAVVAPVVYGATAKVESQGTDGATGSVWGLLLAGGASLFAVLGEMAAMGLLAWSVSDSAVAKWAIVIGLGLGAAAVGVYSLRSLTFFATLPAPRAKQQPPGAIAPIRQSLLGNKTFSATL